MDKAGSSKKSVKVKGGQKSLKNKERASKKPLSDKAKVSKKLSMAKVRDLTKSLLETFNKRKSGQLNELRLENEFCDLTLKSNDGTEIKVHRLVVTSASNYFKKKTTKKFEECISIPDITGDILEKIITFIYTNEFEEKIEDVEKIIKYAEVFQLQELVEICLLTLKNSINDHTCVKYWRLGRDSRNSDLEEKCLAYIVSRADILFKSSLTSDVTLEEMKFFLSRSK